LVAVSLARRDVRFWDANRFWQESAVDTQWLQQIERLLRNGQHDQASSEIERAAAESPKDGSGCLAGFRRPITTTVQLAKAHRQHVAVDRRVRIR
jgi:hypothetical protein